MRTLLVHYLPFMVNMGNAMVNDGFVEGVRARVFISSPSKVPKQLTPSYRLICAKTCFLRFVVKTLLLIHYRNLSGADR